MSSRVLVVCGLVLLTGCLGHPDSSEGELLETAECAIEGAGTLAETDAMDGAVRGDDLSVAGMWTHETDTGSLVEATPEFIFCRINGVTIGDVGGRATMDGVGDYEFRVQVEDRGVPGPAMQSVRASRYYGGCGASSSGGRPCPGPPFVDGHLEVEGSATVDIPASIPVIVGNGGNQWLDVDFTTTEGDDVRCRYRGGASTRNPRTPEDIAAGESYELRGCDCGSGIDYEAGDSVEVTALSVHIRNGSNRFPTSEDAETTVEFELPTGGDGPMDHYRMVLFDADGNRMLTREGDLASGDFTLNAL